MDETVIALVIFGALVGLNYLARNPRAEGMGWRVSGILTRFALAMVPIGFVIAWVEQELKGYFDYRSLDESTQTLFIVALLIGVSLYLGGHLAILVSLLTRAWLRFAAYLRRVGPKQFARNVGHLALTAGIAGIKLAGVVILFIITAPVVGIRNLVFLGLLKGVLDSSAGNGRRREQGNHRAGASSAS